MFRYLSVAQATANLLQAARLLLVDSQGVPCRSISVRSCKARQRAMVTTRTGSRHRARPQRHPPASELLHATKTFTVHEGYMSTHHCLDSDSASSSHVVGNSSAAAENACTAAAAVLQEGFFPSSARRALADLQSESAASQTDQQRNLLPQQQQSQHKAFMETARFALGSQIARVPSPGSFSGVRKASKGD